MVTHRVPTISLVATALLTLDSCLGYEVPNQQRNRIPRAFYLTLKRGAFEPLYQGSLEESRAHCFAGNVYDSHVLPSLLFVLVAKGFVVPPVVRIVGEADFINHGSVEPQSLLDDVDPVSNRLTCQCICLGQFEDKLLCGKHFLEHFTGSRQTQYLRVQAESQTVGDCLLHLGFAASGTQKPNTEQKNPPVSTRPSCWHHW